jgi:hypothetical protein
MDLTTVRQKLENNEYPTVRDWKEDIFLTFSNAISYNGKQTPVGVTAVEMKAIFKDLVKTIVDDQNSAWINELVKLRKDLCDHVVSRSAPMFGQAHSRVVGQNQSQAPVDATAEIRRLVVNCMAESDLGRLAGTLSQMTEQSQINRIAEIIQGGNPEINSEDRATIDLNLLAPQTLMELREYVATQLEAGTNQDKNLA